MAAKRRIPSGLSPQTSSEKNTYNFSSSAPLFCIDLTLPHA